MAGTGSPSPRTPSQRPVPPGASRPQAGAPVRKLPQVLMLKKEEQAAPDAVAQDAAAPLAPPVRNDATTAQPQAAPTQQRPARSDDDLFGMGELEGLTMADLLGPDSSQRRRPSGGSGSARSIGQGRPGSDASGDRPTQPSRTVDDFDFDEEAFLAALDENEPVGTTGEVVRGVVIALESDGVYVDIGGKAPGFMPKNECGLGVITNLKERFPKGAEVEVLVTREQNADGMVTVSARALALRQSWDKVRQLEKDGQVVQVKVNGFNRGGVTCDLEGLRGFIPRSQLNEGENHEALVGKTIGAAFLEVNPETRKLVLSEKKAASAARFAALEIGQLVEGQVVAVKPYGLFVDLGGVSGLLHHSSITGGQMRDLREVFDQGDRVKALITDLDPGRGRIALNTALLEGQPGELLIEKDKVMAEATDRANRARSVLRQQEQNAG
ncbi:S1 RNA-binding domain-containing protein [Synechococcus sp. CBW1002]|jgi:small subunit ribosomal protein S1|uniref:S1 RNA-binding domain-containing protein n=1 Tax=unclassified Synechococcus TaxID=2626047 RepID=UPI0018CFBDC8|nr:MULTISPECIES: S1 RNA-binding domain-containing protein [unclassified Synechococcus]QPN59981.1 S1 RNA-binding domain-containing protein [Synechococcus sp. CBW1002]QPN66786.1 S1 RNA-binding domain-containing protein [Synechococcus sp. CBW1006]